MTRFVRNVLSLAGWEGTITVRLENGAWQPCTSDFLYALHVEITMCVVRGHSTMDTSSVSDRKVFEEH